MPVINDRERAMETFRGSREELTAVLQLVPAMVAGRVPDRFGIARRLQLRVGVALLSQVQQDFVRKARGGPGRDGITWKPLKRETIAQRRTTAAERRNLGIGGERVRGLLTPAEDARWKAIFRSVISRLREDGVGEREAASRAAQSAWGILKSQGAKTKLATLGGRSVEILRDTGELFRSLSPGVEDRPSNADGQVFRVPTGRVIVGTNKKTWHHRGIPGRLPSRPLWPLNDAIPQAWWPAIQTATMRGLQVAIAEVLRNGARA
jgi:hypothetical protein